MTSPVSTSACGSAAVLATSGSKRKRFGLSAWLASTRSSAPHGFADAEKSYATLRYAHHLKYFPKWNPEIEAFHNLEFLPQIDDFDNHLIKADVGFTTKIIMDFDLLAKIEWDYNSMPSVGRKSSDFRYIVGLGYKW